MISIVTFHSSLCIFQVCFRSLHLRSSGNGTGCGEDGSASCSKRQQRLWSLCNCQLALLESRDGAVKLCILRTQAVPALNFTISQLSVDSLFTLFYFTLSPFCKKAVAMICYSTPELSAPLMQNSQQASSQTCCGRLLQCWADPFMSPVLLCS